MSVNLPEMLTGTMADAPEAVSPPPARAAPGVTLDYAVRPHNPAPLDWSHAVDAAAARLEESWVRPDVTGHMLASGLAAEFAATLCAYGMMTAEVEHMHDLGDALPATAKAAAKLT